MFDRIKYKDFAKKQLKNRWGLPILITFFCNLIIYIIQLPDFIGNLILYNEFFTGSYYDFYNITIPEGSFSYARLLVLFIVEAIFIFAQLNVYLKMSKTPQTIKYNTFFDGFNLWTKALFSYLWKLLWISLWSLLFIIPGIVKSYSYSLMEYICIEYKNVSVQKAMNISKVITNGHKADLFVLDLSFIGWEFLCFCTFGIGFLWLIPYKNMTKVNAYHAILKEAVLKGIITQEDLEIEQNNQEDSQNQGSQNEK